MLSGCMKFKTLRMRSHQKLFFSYIEDDARQISFFPKQNEGAPDLYRRQKPADWKLRDSYSQ